LKLDVESTVNAAKAAATMKANADTRALEAKLAAELAETNLQNL